MSWFNHRPKGYKHIRGAEAVSATPLTGTFDASRREAPPAAEPLREGAHEATFVQTTPAANADPAQELAVR